MAKKRKTLRPSGSGNLYEYHGSVYLRFWLDGVRHKQLLGRCSELPTAQDKERAVREVLDGLPLSKEASGRNTTLAEFVERSYLPGQKLQRRASTYAEYDGMFRRHIKPLPEAQLKLWDYRTPHVQRLLNAIAERRAFSVTSLRHHKAFLSGVFRHAAILGLSKGNPVHETMLPARSVRPRDTVAYTMDEIRTVLAQLKDDNESRAIVAIAAFAGLRRSEIQGLRFCDYDGETLTIAQTVWQSHVNPPKSKASASWVPVIAPLRAILDEYIAEHKREDVCGTFLPQNRMFLLTLDHLGRKTVNAAFTRAGLRFSGFHGFRRGLASNLFELGADDLTVQRILRHASVQVTREHYIKLRSAKVDAAMDALSRAVLSKMDNGTRPGLQPESKPS